MSFSRTLTSASPNVKIGCRAYLCEARRALSEPVVDPMYVLLHFALSLNILYTHPVGICPGYLSNPKKILLPPPAVFSHIRETICTRVAAWAARSGMWISNRPISHLDVRDPSRPDEMTNLFCRPEIRQPVVRSHFVCTNDENDEMLKYFNVYFYFRSMTSNSVDLYENSSSFVISSGSKPWSFWCLVESAYCKFTNHKISMSTRRPPARALSPPCTHCSSATRSTRRGQFPNRRPSRPYLASGGPLPLGSCGPFPS